MGPQTFRPSPRVRELRARLDHPIVDGDGHLLESVPLFFDFLRKEAGDVLAREFAEMLRRRPPAGCAIFIRGRRAAERPSVRRRESRGSRVPCKQAMQASAAAGACQLEIALAESKSPMWRRQLAGILACRRSRDLREKSLCFVHPQFRSEHAP